MSADARFDLTVRVGCSLAYEVTGSASVILNVQPRPAPNCAMVFEALTLGDNLPATRFVDLHGNNVWRMKLRPGTNCVRHDAIVAVSSLPDNAGIPISAPPPPDELPTELLRYTLPSRYCDSDRLADFAWQHFGQIEHGWTRAQAISRWIHENIEYRFLSGQSELSAWDILQRGYGVCRDFAHLAIALNRSFNLPARYVTGHLPDIGVVGPDSPMDFHAYAEVYVGGHWLTIDPRFHTPRIARLKIGCGADAVDGAFSTIFGGATLSYFEVWAYQVARGTVGVGDPIDLSRRLDNQAAIRRDAPEDPASIELARATQSAATSSAVSNS